MPLPFALPAIGSLLPSAGDLISKGLAGLGNLFGGIKGPSEMIAQINAQVEAQKHRLGAINNGVTNMAKPIQFSPVVADSVFNRPRPLNMTDNAMSPAQTALFGSKSNGLVIGGQKVSLEPVQPWYKNPWILVSAIAVVGGVLYFVFKRKRRK